jgi:hypothetical protein
MALHNVTDPEGWEFHPGVPNGVDDGWFTENLGIVGEVPEEPPEPGAHEGFSAKEVTVAAHDGWPAIFAGDQDLSPTQAERMAELLLEAAKLARSYQPKPWMRDPKLLLQRKATAYSQVLRQAGYSPAEVADFERAYRDGEVHAEVAALDAEAIDE